jgi:hypothetical protein
VNGRHHVVGEPGALDRLAAVLRHPEAAPEERLSRRRAERNEHVRSDESQLGVEPRPARGELRRVGLVVDPALAARLPLEVLDRVRDVHLTAIDAGFLECFVEHAAGGPDERMTGDVFLVTGLLADEHYLRRCRAFTEHGLRCVAPQVATATLVHCTTHSCECAFTLHELDR